MGAHHLAGRRMARGKNAFGWDCNQTRAKDEPRKETAEDFLAPETTRSDKPLALNLALLVDGNHHPRQSNPQELLKLRAKRPKLHAAAAFL